MCAVASGLRGMRRIRQEQRIKNRSVVTCGKVTAERPGHSVEEQCSRRRDELSLLREQYEDVYTRSEGLTEEISKSRKRISNPLRRRIAEALG